MALAGQRKIEVARTVKADELRKMLQKKLRRDHLLNELQDFEQSLARDAAERAALEKLRMLAHTVTNVTHALYRFDQVNDLLRGSIFRYRVYAEAGDDPLSRRLCKAWVFAADDRENLPPFFPGDSSTIRTERLGPVGRSPRRWVDRERNPSICSRSSRMRAQSLEAW